MYINAFTLYNQSIFLNDWKDGIVKTKEEIYKEVIVPS